MYSEDQVAGYHAYICCRLAESFLSETRRSGAAKRSCLSGILVVACAEH